MSQQSLEVFYEPNRRLAHAHGLQGYNAGYAEARGHATFDQYQKDLVWRLLGDVEIGPESTVLDVGCGIGGPSGWIYERYHPARLFGIEYCATSARTAEERWAGKPQRPIFLQGDAHCLPVPDRSVDVIFNLESALHYADKRKFISECLRTLKPGGVLCLGDITTRYKKTFAVLGTLNLLTSASVRSRALTGPRRSSNRIFFPVSKSCTEWSKGRMPNVQAADQNGTTFSDAQKSFSTSMPLSEVVRTLDVL